VCPDGNASPPRLRRADAHSQGILLNQHHIIGVPRLRQIRSQYRECDVPSELRSNFTNCFSEPTSSIAREVYGDNPGLTSVTYKSRGELNDFGTWGRVWSYDGGG
jgi:hypothetical protein